MPPEPYFCGDGFDRADQLRADEAAIAGLCAQTDAVELLWDNGAPAIDEAGRLRWQAFSGERPVFLGLNGGTAHFSSLPDGDAPIDARDLKRLAARAVFAMARTGSSYSNGSGDFAIAFSTHPSLRVTGGGAAPQPRLLLTTDAVSGLFAAVLDATEEAIYNSLLQARDMTGNGTTIRALPIEPLRELLKKHGR